MASWVDRLRKLNPDRLKQLIAEQECAVKIAQRDLETLRNVLKEKEHKHENADMETRTGSD